VLTRGTDTEIRARDEDGRPRRGGLVENEFGIGTPGGEQAIGESLAVYPLEVFGRDYLVGVDVAAAQRHSTAAVGGERLHGFSCSSGQCLLERVRRRSRRAAAHS
jgi:hypothetical protein